MQFEHSCFISYRHGQAAVAGRLIEDFFFTLSAELEFLVDKPPYLDRDRLKGGEFYNEALASNLCKSACLVVLYTPVYFSLDHMYCAREYRAMEQIELARLERLGDVARRNRGLIIPVVCRGMKYLPDVIRARRQFYDFEKYLLGYGRLQERRRALDDVKSIAEYVAELVTDLSAVEDPIGDCGAFRLPSEEDVKNWLNEVPQPVNRRPAFPWRS